MKRCAAQAGLIERWVGQQFSAQSLRSCMLANVFINGHQGRQECSPEPRLCVLHNSLYAGGGGGTATCCTTRHPNQAAGQHYAQPDTGPGGWLLFEGGACVLHRSSSIASLPPLPYAGLVADACTRHGQLSMTRIPPPRIAQVAALADAAHGFVAADLAALCSEAAMIALRRLVAQSRGSSHGDASGGSPRGTPCVTLADFQAAETRVRPSAMRELAFEVPKVRCRHGLRLFCVHATGNWWL